MKSLNNFIDEFNSVQNALEMRKLIRWNGRDVRETENLSEHTHLVIVCLFEILDDFKKYHQLSYLNYDIENLVRHALFHDSLELLRGDILSSTKDYYKLLREQVDNEEEKFMSKVCKLSLDDTEKIILRLADLMACYKFIEWELRYPSNDYLKKAYIQAKNNYDTCRKEFLSKYNIYENIDNIVLSTDRFNKGYLDDAGTDIILDRDVTFMPMSTEKFDLNIKITPNIDEASFLYSRTSAAAKGLIVSHCPIDANYNGNVTAIVNNISNNIITYKKGESFCQYVTFKILTNRDVRCKKDGKRSKSKLGETDK